MMDLRPGGHPAALGDILDYTGKMIQKRKYLQAILNRLPVSQMLYLQSNKRGFVWIMFLYSNSENVT
jgi:hypothetical protein